MKATAIFLLMLPMAAAGAPTDTTNYARLVNPFIGTGGHGHTFPGVSLPFGMVQLSPDTRVQGWDACAGYHYSDSTILGFSHTHLSGTGAIDYGDILLMPTVGTLQLVPGGEDQPQSGYRSRFRHASEQAHAGYYRVQLDEHGIVVELTATARAGLHKYVFPASPEANIILDLRHGLGPDRVLEAELEFVSDTEIAGLRRSQGWAADQRVYFVAQFSRPFAAFGVAKDGRILPGRAKAAGTNLQAFVRYLTQPQQEILVKVGLSAVSIAGARDNLQREIPDWDFARVRRAAEATWNAALGKIVVRGGSADERTIFYTALYHTLLAPHLFMDGDGRYRGRDGRVHRARGFTNYTVFSLWDTFRATHPLFTIIERARTRDFIHTMLAQFEQAGSLPVWELAGNETHTMIGYHAVPVIVDAHAKGIRDFDAARALAAMRHSAEVSAPGLRPYRELGYIPAEDEPESVSKTLEYAYDDWCIAQMAGWLGDHKSAQRYRERAAFYRNLFDPKTGFMRGRRNGGWIEPFDPAEVIFEYTEANAWHYSFFVPQAVTDHIDLLGGEARFLAKLDSLFHADSALPGKFQPDISGMLGQYAHGNEPCHHVAYLHNYAGVPWKTQERVRAIMTKLYTNSPAGLCGNDDCGQLSAWYVFSALGFYPVCPGSDFYVIGSPLFPRATLHLEDGSRFVIGADQVSAANKYIQSARLGAAPHRKSYLRHEDILRGGELTFAMGPAPNPAWGAAHEDRPQARLASTPAVVTPLIQARAASFLDTMTVQLVSLTPGATLHYTLDGSEPTPVSPRYDRPIRLTATTTVKAIAVKAGMQPSKSERAVFLAVPERRRVELLTAYRAPYTGGGDQALVDFVRGTANFRSGAWQGFHRNDLEAIVDCGRVRPLRRIAAGFLQNVGSWIFFPTAVEFAVSDDGRQFRVVAGFHHETAPTDQGAMLKEFARTFDGLSGRYVRVRARNIGHCPPWHYAAGGEAWLFADEIVIE
ncbi:MAG: GH92 family glycosyl hydrolase [candidate division KSB1 bacterium]|nr:GH92 family glycosyl hydrolase [candidate division KSB1 bacterium]MDZ7276156.1 GH92 family glycosyl hydrolase [candidate division KSB1 bacterium]MDZ7287064.1 GH92 family glycosyl hydrolase [candidate division KSB1 bacterium]MDZ7297011.1 GH92 family glycosyl hydrolase [candidate division KSB1 bacterium]MDZ7307517.1 GH92 family glycosyl hydrolase [candidate division KSB1 bacterium]